MNDQVSGSMSDIGADLAALRRDVADLAVAVRATAEIQTQAAGARVSDAVGDARNGIAQAASEARKSASAASAEVGASIERNPLTAMLIALGAGVVIGAMSRSHR